MAKRKSKSTTIYDVARLATVSPATVSAVVNGTAVVSPARTKRVREAMAALDYHPDHIARSLKTGKTHAIGMVVPDVTNPFFPEVIRGVEQAAGKAGYSIIFVNSNEDPEQERRGLEALISRRVDGALIACCDNTTATFDLVSRRNVPTVFLDRVPLGVNAIRISTDNFKAGLVGTKHLIDLGHERIAIVAGRMDLSPHVQRVEGFRKAMQEPGIPVRDEYFRTGSLSSETGYQIGKQLLQLERRPTAIFCTNNKTLLGLVRALGECNVSCPDEVSVLGFDDFAWTENFHPKLTTIVQPAQELGRRGMEMLIQQIKMHESGEANPPSAYETVLLEAELKIRESTAPPPSVGLPASGSLAESLPR
ncbi:MAG: LacI family transcriptional regulator [Acidobacteriia bacterium]|nr:LacI family transcriptional regulator [Terriglobia bacterium]